MRKVHSDAGAALAGLLHDDMTIVAGGFGLCGIPENLIDAIVAERREGPDGRQQQLRRRRLGPRQAARPPPDQEDDQLLRRREQGVRAPVPRGRGRGRVQPARHPGRAHPRRRRRHPGLLHQDRRRHPGRRGQGAPRLRRRDLRHGARHRLRPRHRQGLEGRPRGQPRLPEDGAELQSRWRRRPARCASPRSRSWSSPAELDPDHVHTPGIYVDRIVQGAELREAHRAAHHPQARA